MERAGGSVSGIAGKSSFKVKTGNEEEKVVHR
jgi:hypothetical protein